MPTGLIRHYTQHLAPPWPGGPRTNPLDRGLIVEWRFDPVTGLMLTDWSGYARHVVASRANTEGIWTITQHGHGLQFIHTFGQTNITIQQTGIAGASALTMEVFFQMNALSGSWQYTPTLSFDQTAATSMFYPGYNIRGDANAAKKWQLVTGDVNRTVNGIKARPAPGDFVHAVLTYDGAHVTGYREGLYDGQVAATGTIDDSYLDPAGELHLNARSAHDVTILLARLYNRALTDAEPRLRYNLCLQRTQPMAHAWMTPQAAITVPPPPGWHRHMAMTGVATRFD